MSRNEHGTLKHGKLFLFMQALAGRLGWARTSLYQPFPEANPTAGATARQGKVIPFPRPVLHSASLPKRPVPGQMNRIHQVQQLHPAR